jgi:hypothetical protein
MLASSDIQKAFQGVINVLIILLPQRFSAVSCYSYEIIKMQPPTALKMLWMRTIDTLLAADVQGCLVYSVASSPSYCPFLYLTRFI